MLLRAFWVLIALGSAVVLGEADLYQQQYPAGSEGLAACSENVQGNHCWRADNPRPTEVCVERDPVSQICLRVIPSAAAAVLPERETGYVDLEMSASGGTVTCSGEDPYCVPDGVHLGTGNDPFPLLNSPTFPHVDLLLLFRAMCHIEEHDKDCMSLSHSRNRLEHRRGSRVPRPTHSGSI